MRLSSVFSTLFLFLIYPSVILTGLLYSYPWIANCDFPAPIRQQEEACIVNKNEVRTVNRRAFDAPFRLLALGDPQLEGDSSLPKFHNGFFPSLWKPFDRSSSPTLGQTLTALGEATRDVFVKDIWRMLSWLRKRIDLFGNDFYLAHIYRSVRWWSQPTHVTVLGDLLGSQWISDAEFERRGWRFWHRVFRGGRRVEDHVMHTRTEETLGWDADWARRVINVAGNHDIGYAGDIDKDKMARFERVFGRANWDLKLRLPPAANASTPFGALGGPPELRIVVLNSMNLDGPAKDFDLQMQNYKYINEDLLPSLRPVEDRRAAVVVLTHIPLYKDDGVCADGPAFDFKASGVREQNHLSRHASSAVLQAVLGMSADPDAPAGGHGRKGVVLTGHDHVGCDVYHHIPADRGEGDEPWRAKRWEEAGGLVAEGIPGVREVTVRSMMGEFGGNAGLLSAWFDEEEGEWRFEYASCSLGVQHIWWAVHILDLIVLVAGVGAGVALVVEEIQERRATADALLGKKTNGDAVKTPNGSQNTGVASATGRHLGAGTPRRTARKEES